MIAGLLERPDTGGNPMDNQMFEDYNKKCKRLSRKIWFLIYPDTLCHHSAYNKLTDSQKHELQKFLMAALEPDNDELGVPKGFVNADMRSFQYTDYRSRVRFVGALRPQPYHTGAGRCVRQPV